MALASGMVGPLFMIVVLRLASVSGDLALLPKIDDVRSEDSFWWRTASCLFGLNIPKVILKRFFNSWQQDNLVDLGVFNRTPEYSWMFDTSNYLAKISLAVLFICITDRTVWLALAYFVIALLLTFAVYWVPPYQNEALNVTLRTLRAVVTFTCAIAIGITVVDDKDDPWAHFLSIAWWVGTGSAVLYYAIPYACRHCKTLEPTDSEINVDSASSTVDEKAEASDEKVVECIPIYHGHVQCMLMYHNHAQCLHTIACLQYMLQSCTG